MHCNRLRNRTCWRNSLTWAMIKLFTNCHVAETFTWNIRKKSSSNLCDMLLLLRPEPHALLLIHGLPKPKWWQRSSLRLPILIPLPNFFMNALWSWETKSTWKILLFVSYFINAARETTMLNLLSFAQAIVNLRSTNFMSSNLKFISKESVHIRCFVQMQLSISPSCLNLSTEKWIEGVRSVL